MARVIPLSEAIHEHVADGDCIALEGFTHLIPFAAGHELIRQGKSDLVLARMTPDVICDQLIGAGRAAGLIFSWAGNPGVGSLWRFRDAVENGWPRPIQLEEHSHDGMAARYAAGASDLPFGVLRGYVSEGLAEKTSTIRPLTCPFTGGQLTALRALRPDVAVIHAQRADRFGNVELWGILGVQKEAALAARRTIVTVEELVDELEPRAGAIRLPHWVLTAVCVVRGGAHPSYASGYSDRDNSFYRQWDALSRTRASFIEWLTRHVLGTRDHAEYLASLEGEPVSA